MGCSSSAQVKINDNHLLFGFLKSHSWKVKTPKSTRPIDKLKGREKEAFENYFSKQIDSLKDHEDKKRKKSAK